MGGMKDVFGNTFEIWNGVWTWWIEQHATQHTQPRHHEVADHNFPSFFPKV
jgi:hypothetical protein